MMNQKVRKVLAPLAVGALACSLAVATPMAANAALNGGTDDVIRIQGVDRIQTAIAASNAFDGDRADVAGETVIIADKDAWQDVISATPLAAKLGANVLYTDGAKLDTRVTNELVRLGSRHKVKNVIIIGGEAVVSDAVAAALEAIEFDVVGGAADQKFTVDRIGGENRYETALQIAAATIEASDATVGTTVRDARRAVLANNKNLNAVARTSKALAEAQANYASAFTAKVTAEVAVTTANSTIAALVGTLKVATTPAEKAALDQAAIDANLFLKAHRLGSAAAAEASIAPAPADTPAADAWEAFYDGEGNGGGADTTKPTYAVSADSTTAPTPAQITTMYDAYLAAQADFEKKTAAYVSAASAAEENATTVARIAALTKELGTSTVGATAGTGLKLASEKASAAYDKAVALFSGGTYGTPAVTVAPADSAQGKAIAAPTQQANAEAAVAPLQAAYDAALKALIKAEAEDYTAFVARGDHFADALAAGPAAARNGGIVLLSEGTALDSKGFAKQYLDEADEVVAIGGQAAAALPDADLKLFGANRWETAVAVANKYGAGSGQIGLASGTVAADAVIGGAVIAAKSGLVVLTSANALPKATADFLTYSYAGNGVVVFGGTNAVSSSVLNQVKSIVGG